MFFILVLKICHNINSFNFLDSKSYWTWTFIYCMYNGQSQFHWQKKNKKTKKLKEYWTDFEQKISQKITFKRCHDYKKLKRTAY